MMLWRPKTGVATESHRCFWGIYCNLPQAVSFVSQVLKRDKFLEARHSGRRRNDQE
jgi:hypothetical protein